MGITAAVLEQVAEEEGCDPLELPPLYDSIDADALERCLESADTAFTFRFTYCDYTITVRGNGEVTIDVVSSSDPQDVDPVR